MDYSFIKLYKNDFDAAVANDNEPAYLTCYSGFVQQRPDETFCQWTNLPETIAFGGNILVELIDICGNVLRDITNRFWYREFTDEFGIGQIRFQFGNLHVDYGQELLFLKITHTASDKIWYSSGFMVTDHLWQETTMLHYRNLNFFAGISYNKVDAIAFNPQWVRLTCFRSDWSHEKEGEKDVELSGHIRSSRSIISRLKKYLFYTIDFFTYDRLVTLLDHEIIYIDGFRVSDKPNVEKGERVEDTNFFEASFLANITEEKMPKVENLYGDFTLDEKTPLGTYRNIPNTIFGRFSRQITKGIGTLKVYKKSDNSVFATFNQDQITVTGDNFTIDTSALSFPVDDFYIKVSSGLFISEFFENFEITNDTDWTFRKAAARFNPTRFNNNRFL